MRVLVIGSINIDDVFSLPRFVRPGETISCRSYARHIGGKGDNQAVALARAGAEVSFAGKIGEDGRFILDSLARAGVDVSRVAISELPTGRAMIQVQDDGQNCIILAPGANRDIRPADIDAFLEGWGPGDMAVFQNEISSMDYALEETFRRGLAIVLNPSPITDSLLSLPIGRARWLILNETEGQALTGSTDVDEIAGLLRGKYPDTEIILTLGERGSRYEGLGGESLRIPALEVKVVDTTAAGDCFTGFFLADILSGSNPGSALVCATRAAAICVGRAGAQPSIPSRAELAIFDPEKR
jgi:ribokinase